MKNNSTGGYQQLFSELLERNQIPNIFIFQKINQKLLEQHLKNFFLLKPET